MTPEERKELRSLKAWFNSASPMSDEDFDRMTELEKKLEDVTENQKG